MPAGALVAAAVGAGVVAARRRLPPTVPAQLTAGCRPEELPARIPHDVRRAARWLTRYLRFVERVAGGKLTVRGWWRAPVCNARRAGAERSRHLGAWAIDVDPSRAQIARLRAALLRGDWADRVRAATGWRGTVGAKMYESGAVHFDLGCHGTPLCDPRDEDWVVVEAG